MTSNNSASRRSLLAIAALLFLFAAVLAARPAQADFIVSNIKIIECGAEPCTNPVRQPFEIDAINSVSVNKDIILPPNSVFTALHVLFGLWPEKDLKHIGFRCLDTLCNELTGFDSGVDFRNPEFVTNIPDLKGLTSVGTIVPDTKTLSPQAAIDWLPGRVRSFFDGKRIEDNGTTVAVLFAHIPEPATVTLFGFGLLGLGLAAVRRRPAA